MFKSILFTICSLLLISSISGLTVHHRSSIQRTVKRAVFDMESSIQTLRNLHSTFVTMADPAADAACNSAINQASANITADCVTTGFLTSGGNVNLDAFNAIPIGPVCEAKLASTVAAKCVATFTAQYQLSVQVCGANNSTNVVLALVGASGGPSFFANLTGLVTFGKAICTKDGNTYCYDALTNATQGLAGGIALGNINNTLATAICTACTKKLMNNLLAIGAGSVSAELGRTLSALKFMCTVDPTDPNNQCMNSVALLAKFQGKTTTADFSAIITTSSQADVNVLCSPCTTAVINNADSLTAFGIAPTTIAALKGAAPFLSGICVKDGGDYCAYKLGAPLAAWAGALVSSPASLGGLSSVCSAELGTTKFNPCSAGCAAGISAVFSPFGCCIGVATNNGKDKATFVAAIQASANAQPGVNPAVTELVVAAMNNCAITFPTSCAAPTAVPLTVNFVLDNIKASWATSANFQSKFTDAFKADVASAFGLDVSAITGVTVADNGKGSTKVTFTINTNVDIIAGLKATIQSRINTKTMAFGQTSALASQDNGAGKVDQASGVEASTSSTVDGGASAAFASKNIMGSIVLTMLSLLAIKLF